ncbi:uncharacterized protein DUF4419 [Taibaiella chishuiensis]|uniref:Uncharacterized protein DUF4419 n=1 Tax=Taibaiella chishuiensis TaxID=1434707 RepID=A0A2P8CX73_9BACT|nr:uncharacterized protein DUF4419 [Taibaiella chishuiensis]
MIKYTFTLLCLAFTWAASGQDKGITFQVEALKRPDGLITELPGKEITARIAPEALVSSIDRDNQVYLGAHPFFNGMYKAYAEHRPFELSPDMIWLLICQGFAQHVNNNAEALRSYFVNFEGRKSLVVGSKEIASPGKLSTWENLLPKLLEQAGASSDPELFATLAPTFSTTGASERLAMQITALESTKAYFEYIVLYVACGIPEITLKGTPED